jgi:phosphoribosylamine--glycine ligase
MRFLVLGTGGREHAIVKALKNSPSVSEVHASPGSKGMAGEAICHNVNLSDEKELQAFVQRHSFDCVVVGPEAYLAAGIADQIRAVGVRVVGPSHVAAQLEASKVFAKKFMADAGVPTARFVIVEDVESTLAQASTFQPPYVLKADGLAAGKGVFICENLNELKSAAEDLFVKQALGEAGRKALLEQFQPGYELSLLILTNGSECEALPMAQDHKRLLNGDKGPNTGGMGTVAPVDIDPNLRAQIHEQIVVPTLRHLGGSGMLYRGVLFIGLMITKDGPQTLEFNVRFGDPETQVIMPLLDGDWGQVFINLADGTLSPLKWKPLHLTCVVLAAPGYPDKPEKGLNIDGELKSQTSSSYFIHAGTDMNERGEWITAGGRVLNAIGIGSTRAEAIKQAYTQAAKNKNLIRRSDIGAKLT